MCMHVCVHGVDKECIYYNQMISWNVNLWLFLLSHHYIYVSYPVGDLRINLRSIQIL